MPVAIHKKGRKPQKVFSIPKEQQPIPTFKENPGVGNWRKEAIVCQDCGWSGIARLNNFWTLDKFVCAECRGSLRIDE